MSPEWLGGEPSVSLPEGAEPSGRTAGDEPLLAVRDLKVAFPVGRGLVYPVRGVSLRIARGQRVGLIGESGSGKSLTALSVMRLVPSPGRVEGRVVLEGRDLLRLSERAMAGVRGGEVAMVYQNPLSSLNPVQRIGDQIAEAIRTHVDLPPAQARRRAIELLAEVGIPEPAERYESYPHQFSGGMRQRVMIAMALSADPQLLIADEPTTALDVTTQARILELLLRLVEERQTAVLLITHDLGVAASLCEDIRVMYAGRIVEAAPADHLYPRPIHPYSEVLLESIVGLDFEVEESVPAIPGQPPIPGQLPTGCSFHTRCPYAQPICEEVVPPSVVLRSPGLEVVAECHFAENRWTGTREAEERRGSGG